ncbi:MAG: CD1107 family mobile element protein [Neglectibacter timonensis]
MDNATARMEEFYTITTADERVLSAIDKQKTSENVYFLNTVTTDDLLPLAEQGKEPPKVTLEPGQPTESVEEVLNPSREKGRPLSLCSPSVRWCWPAVELVTISRFTSRSMKPGKMITANMRTGKEIAEERGRIPRHEEDTEE